MGFDHRTAGSGSGRRGNPSKREWQRAGIVSQSEYQSEDSIAVHLSPARPAARTATDVLRLGDVDLALNRQRSAAVRAAILQDRMYGRIGDRRNDRQKDSRDCGN